MSVCFEVHNSLRSVRELKHLEKLISSLDLRWKPQSNLYKKFSHLYYMRLWSKFLQLCIVSAFAYANSRHKNLLLGITNEGLLRIVSVPQVSSRHWRLSVYLSEITMIKKPLWEWWFCFRFVYWCVWISKDKELQSICGSKNVNEKKTFYRG